MKVAVYVLFFFVLTLLPSKEVLAQNTHNDAGVRSEIAILHRAKQYNYHTGREVGMCTELSIAAEGMMLFRQKGFSFDELYPAAIYAANNTKIPVIRYFMAEIVKDVFEYPDYSGDDVQAEQVIAEYKDNIYNICMGEAIK